MKKNKIACLLLTLGALATHSTFAAQTIDAKKHLKRVPASGIEMHEMLGLSDDYKYKIKSKRWFQKGIEKQRMSQYFKGIPVWGHSVTAEISSMGILHQVSGKFTHNIASDITSVAPLIDRANIKLRHRKMNADENNDIAHHKADLVIYIHNDKAHLAYATDYVVYGKLPRRPTAIIDANDGRVLVEYDGLATNDAMGPGGNEKTGPYYYGNDYGFLDVSSNCEMDNTNVTTIDMNHATTGGSVHQFTCPENLYKEINGSYSALNDAHYFGGVVFDMYQDWFNTAPLIFKLGMRVHYDTDYENAFWDGQQMTFGDGLDKFHPLVSLDVVSHEVSHGFTEQNSGLAYFSQSGGMNESFSDVMGELAKNYMRGTNDWHVGKDIFKAQGALRYMDNPPLDGESIDHASDFHAFMNVHHSSGVFNKAFYLLTNTPGWDIRMAGETYVVANQLYWWAGSSFEEGACGVYTAANDLGYDLDDVENAFAEVGITMCTDFSEERPPTDSDFTNIDNNTVLTELWSDDRVHLKYVIEVPQGAKNLNISINGPIVDTQNDNANLVVQYEGIPTPVDNVCFPDLRDNNETCNFADPAAGYWYIVVEAQVSFEDLTLTVNYDDSNSTPDEGDSGTESDLSANRNQWVYRVLDIPENIARLEAELTGGSGNADLYLKLGDEPSNRDYDCRSRNADNEENCIIETPGTGQWYIGIRGNRSSFNDVTLNWHYQP